MIRNREGKIYLKAEDRAEKQGRRGKAEKDILGVKDQRIIEKTERRYGAGLIQGGKAGQREIWRVCRNQKVEYRR